MSPDADEVQAAGEEPKRRPGLGVFVPAQVGSAQARPQQPARWRRYLPPLTAMAAGLGILAAVAAPATWHPWGVLAVGLGFTVLFTAYVFTVADRVAAVRRLVDERTRQLRDSHRQLQEAQQLAQVGSWEWDIRTGNVVWSEEEYRLFGFPKDGTPSVDSFFDRVHPEDRPGVYRPIRRALVRGPCDFTHRVVLPDGTIRFLHELGQVTFDAGGKPIRMVGTTQDITASQQAQHRAVAEEVRTKTLLELSQTSGQSAIQVANYALEGAVALTGSTIGYIAFANEDETVLTMHCWSKDAMQQCAIIDKPIVYQVKDTGLWGEAIRQRKPVITNDYAAENPHKKGIPPGHVPLTRHVNIPVFDGEKIVAVAGVGNKKENYNDDDVRQLTLLMDGMWRILCRKRAKEALRENEEHLRLMMANLPVGVYQFYARPNGEMGLYRADGRFQEIFGLFGTPDQLFPQFVEHLDPRDRQRFADSVQEAIREGKPWDFEGRFIRPSGETIWVHGMATPSPREDEIVFDGLMLNIDDRKRAKEALQESEERYRSLFHRSPIPLREEDYSEVKAHLDRLRAAGVQDFEDYFRNHPEAVRECAAKVKVLDVNQAVLDLHGAASTEQLLAGLDAIFTEESYNTFRDALVWIAEGKTTFDRETPVRTFRGDERQVLLRWVAAPGCEQSLARVYISQIDVTDRRLAEKDLQSYADALRATNLALEKSSVLAEAANRAKSEFLANMSHEIRTPMTAILGYADLLVENVREPAVAEAADTIRRNGQYLLDIINNILDLSKIEAQKLQVEPAACSPAAIVAEVASLMRIRADAKNLALRLEFDGLIPETIRSDPIRLRQILINLIGNAVKFTESGGVRVVTRLQRRPGQKPLVQFDVIDTGIGLSGQQLGQLFQPFAQADTSTSRRFGGSGLGLTISKRLAELLGGDIQVRSARAAAQPSP